MSYGWIGYSINKIGLIREAQVKVLVRDPSKLPVSHENLTVVQGDVMNINGVESFIKEQDVILSSLGMGRSNKPTILFSKGAQNIINSAVKLGVNRFVCVSSAGVEDHPSLSPFYRKIIRPLVLNNVYIEGLRWKG